MRSWQSENGENVSDASVLDPARGYLSLYLPWPRPTSLSFSSFLHFLPLCSPFNATVALFLSMAAAVAVAQFPLTNQPAQDLELTPFSLSPSLSGFLQESRTW